MTLLDADTWTGKIFIDGWTDGGGGTAPAIEPATGDTLGEYGVASVDDVRRAAGVAAAAQAEWAARKPEERAAVLRRAGALFEEHAAEIEDWIVRESGGIPPKAGLETHIAAGECYEAAGLPGHPAGEVLTTNEDRWSFARRRPAGVVSVIAPFNFPLILSIRAVAPALALGNAVLLKPDPRTAVCGGVVLVRIFQEAGLPDGLLSLVPGDGEIGAAVVEAPEVSVVAFTGSTAAGRKVGEAAARGLKRAHLELGGNNALVVLPGADVAKAASAGAFGAFMHQGQICMTSGRHIVHESLYEEYVAALAEKAEHLPVGDPKSGTVALGPIIDEKQLKRVDGIVQDAVQHGARLLAGGTNDGPYYSRPCSPTSPKTTRRGPRRSSVPWRPSCRSRRSTRPWRWSTTTSTACPSASSATSRTRCGSPTGSAPARCTSTSRPSPTRRTRRSAAPSRRATALGSAALRPTSSRSPRSSG